jgi:hypothetical protein
LGRVEDRLLTDFYESTPDSETRAAIDEIERLMVRLQRLSPGAWLPSVVRWLWGRRPTDFCVAVADHSPPPTACPSVPTEAKIRHVLVVQEIVWAVGPLNPLLPGSARLIWRGAGAVYNHPAGKRLARELKRVRGAADVLRAALNKSMAQLSDAVAPFADEFGIAIGDAIAIDQIVAFLQPRRRPGSRMFDTSECVDEFPHPVIDDVDAWRIEFVDRPHSKSRPIRIRFRHNRRLRSCNAAPDRPSDI